MRKLHQGGMFVLALALAAPSFMAARYCGGEDDGGQQRRYGEQRQQQPLEGGSGAS